MRSEAQKSGARYVRHDGYYKTNAVYKRNASKISRQAAKRTIRKAESQ